MPKLLPSDRRYQAAIKREMKRIQSGLKELDRERMAILRRTSELNAHKALRGRRPAGYLPEYREAIMRWMRLSEHFDERSEQILYGLTAQMVRELIVLYR